MKNITKSKTSEYQAWKTMKQRCYDVNNKRYFKYGARGIIVCKKWLKGFNFFINDMGKKPSAEYSLDRIDNNKGYSPKNCRWATAKQQTRNRSTNVNYKNECAHDASIRLGGNRDLVSRRILKGWSIKKAFNTSVLKPLRSEVNGRYY